MHIKRPNSCEYQNCCDVGSLPLNGKQTPADLPHETITLGQPGPKVLFNLADLLLLVHRRRDAVAVVVVVVIAVAAATAAAAAAVELVATSLLPGFASQSSSYKKELSK